MTIAFFGLPLAALLLLEDGHDLGLAVLSPLPAPGRRRLARRLGRGRLIEASDLDAYASVESRLAALDPDLIVSWFWTRKLPEAWLSRARSGAIGSHPSLLPRHRGPNPYFWAIDAGDRETGVSVHRLTKEYDTGAVLATLRIPIGTRNAWQLARALDRPSLSLLRRVTREITEGKKLTEAAQLESEATLAPEPTEEEMKVDWTWSTDRILRRIRALSPIPGLPLEIAGLNFFVVGARETRANVTAILPGEAALRRGPPLSVVVRTGDGALAIDRIVVGVVDDDELQLSEGNEHDGRELAEALMRRSPEMVSSLLD
jgi:methionyl-tRNA formyltransferase